MADQALPAEVLPPSTVVLAQLIGWLLDERLGTASGVCRIEFELVDGKLNWLKSSPRGQASELGGFE